MPKVYLETSFVSYLVARPSRDLIMAARQQITLEWWDMEHAKHELYTSDAVLEEAQRGDSTEVAKRMAILATLPALDVPDEAEALANLLIAKHALPQKAFLDAVHIAVASIYGMDYLLTWNCKHIANLAMRSAIEKTCRAAGYEPPAIGTPEEFI
ncbi:MAG: type II toxin-antitoxin system VapC family toxin [Acidobacteriota bacterium]|nr:type II toxin-antitoxin system VapC family toxin [Acidobacteriota bacterium]